MWQHRRKFTNNNNKTKNNQGNRKLRPGEVLEDKKVCHIVQFRKYFDGWMHTSSLNSLLTHKNIDWINHFIPFSHAVINKYTHITKIRNVNHHLKEKPLKDRLMLIYRQHHWKTWVKWVHRKLLICLIVIQLLKVGILFLNLPTVWAEPSVWVCIWHE